MMIITVCAIIISMITLLYLIMLKKEIKNVENQLDSITHSETNSLINSNFIDYNLINLIKKINNYIKIRNEQEYKNNESRDTLKKTVLNMSHDVRTPLTSVEGYLQMLELNDVQEVDKKRYLNIVKERVGLLHEMLESFFDLAKLESNTFHFELNRINIYSLLIDTVTLYYGDFTNNKIDVTLNIEECLYAIVDENVMKRVFHNLINNMIKHNAHIVRIKGYKKKDAIRLEFMNDTTDINNDNVKLLFDKFYTVSESRTKKNTGLGLAITKELVSKMNGKIEAVYNDNQLTIIIEIPSSETFTEDIIK